MASNYFNQWKRDLVIYLLLIGGALFGLGVLAGAEYLLGFENGFFTTIALWIGLAFFIPAWFVGVMASGNPHGFSEPAFALALVAEAFLALILLTALWLAGRWVIQKVFRRNE